MKVPKIDVITLSHVEDSFSYMKEAEKAAKSVPFIKTANIGILFIMDEKLLLTSEGAHIYQREPRIMETVSIIAKKAGTISRGIEVMGGEYG